MSESPIAEDPSERPLVVTAEYFERLQSGEGIPGPSEELMQWVRWVREARVVRLDRVQSED